MKDGKAAGPDSLSVEMLKNGGEQLQEALLKLLNKIILIKQIPTKMKQSEIITYH